MHIQKKALQSQICVASCWLIDLKPDRAYVIYYYDILQIYSIHSLREKLFAFFVACHIFNIVEAINLNCFCASHSPKGTQTSLATECFAYFKEKSNQIYINICFGVSSYIEKLLISYSVTYTQPVCAGTSNPSIFIYSARNNYQYPTHTISQFAMSLYEICEFHYLKRWIQKKATRLRIIVNNIYKL